MRSPSVKLLAQNALGVLKRFPLEVIFALIGTIAGTINIKMEHDHHNIDNSLYVRLIMMANLGLLLNLSVTLFAESRKASQYAKWLCHSGACLIILGLFFILNPFDNGTADFIRFFLVALAFHLLVSFAAFIGKNDIHAFWQFNKTLFLRFLAAVLYGAVLFLGLAAALGAMVFLFNWKIEWNIFVTLWTWITGMFITVFFLSGVPNDLAEAAPEDAYPKGLKIFTQYVLIPLATVYVIILLSYEVKILVEWRLPKGLVSDMILGYAVFGILSLLLLHPIRNLEENKWLKTFARSFYFLMIPLIVLLMVAIGARIFKYGITEYRYFLIALSCWLTFITVYFLLSKKQNIKVIPVSLCLLALLATYGPQSAFSVSMYSQRRVLVNIFKKYNAFQNGKLLSLNGKKILKKDGKRAVATLDYLVHQHDLTSLQPYFVRDLRSVDDSLKINKGESRYGLRSEKLSWAQNYLGLSGYTWGRYDGVDQDTAEDRTKLVYINAKDEQVTEVKGYDYTIDLENYKESDAFKHQELKYVQQYTDKAKYTYTLIVNGEKHEFKIQAFEQKLMRDKAFARYKVHDNEYADNYDMPQEMLVLSDTTKNYIVTLKFKHLQFNQMVETNNIQPNAVRGIYYIKVLKP